VGTLAVEVGVDFGFGTNETLMRVTLIPGDENMRDFWVGGQGGRLG
jgi:hypothetical protein